MMKWLIYYSTMALILLCAIVVSTFARPKPDIHCVLKKREVFYENKEEWNCMYRCENGKNVQMILPKRYRCPSRIFEKDKS